MTTSSAPLNTPKPELYQVVVKFQVFVQAPTPGAAESLVLSELVTQGQGFFNFEVEADRPDLDAWAENDDDELKDAFPMGADAFSPEAKPLGTLMQELRDEHNARPSA